MALLPVNSMFSASEVRFVPLVLAFKDDIFAIMQMASYRYAAKS